MKFKITKKGLKDGFYKKWKEITMKMQLDINPEDLLSFDKMIAMPAIKVMYIIGLICIAVFGIKIIFEGSVFGFFSGIATVVVGVVIWRIICESAILLFGIYDRLGDIKMALKGEEAKKVVASAATVLTPKAPKETKAVKKPAKRKAKKAIFNI